MKELFYTSEYNHLILIALLKEYGIRKVIASPGGTNVTFIGSLQQDPFFEIYSCVDERSASYMACGLSEASGEPVIINCTGATSSRNYMPGLTEAYYRKLPIIAITSSQDNNRIGHLQPQITDRSTPPSDTVINSYHLQTIKDDEDKWDCYIKVNKALHDISKLGGGPVHINLTTTYSTDYSVKELPHIHKIHYYNNLKNLPNITQNRIGIFVGAHHKWDTKLTEEVDAFCEKYNAVVLCDHTSNYKGKYKVLSSLAGLQKKVKIELLDFDLIIHIGEISGGYEAFTFRTKEVWRVNEDGMIRDQFFCLSRVFALSEIDFFEYYSKKDENREFTQYEEWNLINEKLYKAIPELPFSNIWIAQHLSKHLPANSTVYLGILSSLRSWNFFELDPSIDVYCNTGGFGIEGMVSSLVGASLVNKDKIHYGFLGDLSVFYDLNILGNRHIGNNIRIMVINNGKGMEFRLINHSGSVFGDDTDKYIAAAGHNGNKSHEVLKQFVTSLGYKYLSASTKEEFNNNITEFTSAQLSDHPIVFEIFTDTISETTALQRLEEVIVDEKYVAKRKVSKMTEAIFGKKIKDKIKEIVK